MKRVGGLFDTFCSIDNLMQAHTNARKSKTFYTEVKMVDSNPDKYLNELREAIINFEYHTSEYTSFIKNDGVKVREIFKLPYYPDRIFQWALIQVIEPYLLRNLTDDTYSALPGRGTYAAYKKMIKALRIDPAGTMWCLKIDVKKYYPSIDKKILYEKFERIIKDKGILFYIDEIIYSTPGSTGVPIGNYFSQYSGNIYLSGFDHWVKEQKHVKWYFRYMDDMVFLAATKEELQQLIQDVISYLWNELRLTVKPNWSIFFVDERGIDFIGYVFRHDSIRLRKRIARTLIKVSAQIWKRAQRGLLINYHMYCSINSICGWLRNCDAGGLKQKYVETVWFWVQHYYDTVIKRRKEICSE